MVHCKKSKIEGAGDGLFASRDIPSGIIVSYYNGLRIESDQNYSPDNSNYQIYVDWENTDGSAYVDIPIQCIDYENWLARYLNTNTLQTKFAEHEQRIWVFIMKNG